ncbi:hypothetical protein PCASD_08139 [Puccinia coronata f. sp. avenae]|uniref:Uncharacterized protein n=1 Tax=Puccinia coronata f. sp. avenae TaxID=200324 RepID=A0A2N5VA97_9BASI|nr:hypothetical protein PCASD_08139 [Puccinia coronata f. sp. avenae]
MEKSIYQKKEQILGKVKKNLPCKVEEEEWLDNKGNLIDKKIFIDKIIGLEENVPAQASEGHLKALQNIYKYLDEIVQPVKNSLVKSKKKNENLDKPPAPKKKKPNEPKTSTPTSKKKKLK